MEFRTLKYFITVAREENFTRAAKKIPITQPALTRAIQLLEEELGQKLFERGKYSIKITEAGLILLKYAVEILNIAHKAELDIKMLEEIRGDVYIGCAETDSMKYFARAAKNVQKNYPDVKFNLYSGNIEDICTRLDNGLLDFYVTIQNFDVAKYDSLILPSKDIWGVILRRDDELAAKKYFTAEDLLEMPLILSREALREEYPKWFGTFFDKFRVVATYNLIFNAKMLVLEKIGYLIAIDGLINDSELCFRPFEPQLSSEIRFIWRRDRLLTPQAQILLDEMKKLY